MNSVCRKVICCVFGKVKSVFRFFIFSVGVRCLGSSLVFVSLVRLISWLLIVELMCGFCFVLVNIFSGRFCIGKLGCLLLFFI